MKYLWLTNCGLSWNRNHWLIEVYNIRPQRYFLSSNFFSSAKLNKKFAAPIKIDITCSELYLNQNYLYYVKQ